MDGEIRDRGEDGRVVGLDFIDMASFGRRHEVSGIVGEAKRLPGPAVFHTRTPEKAVAMDYPGTQRIGRLLVLEAHELAEAVFAGDDDSPAVVKVAFDCGARIGVLPVLALGLAVEFLAKIDDGVLREFLGRQPFVHESLVDIAVGFHDVARDGVDIGSVATNGRGLRLAESQKRKSGQSRIAGSRLSHATIVAKAMPFVEKKDCVGSALWRELIALP